MIEKLFKRKNNFFLQAGVGHGFLKAGPLLLLLLVTLLALSCRHKRLDVDVSSVPLDLKMQRFEKRLFDYRKSNLDTKAVRSLRKEFPAFFDLFAKKIIHLPSSSDS